MLSRLETPHRHLELVKSRFGETFQVDVMFVGNVEQGIAGSDLQSRSITLGRDEC